MLLQIHLPRAFWHLFLLVTWVLILITILLILRLVNSLVHQCCACHIINLIVKSGLKRWKHFIDDFRTTINFLNSSNQCTALFKNYSIAKGVRPLKFCLDIDVRWNATYLMLKHLIPYRSIFSVFINSHYGSQLLSENHWYVVQKIL